MNKKIIGVVVIVAIVILGFILSHGKTIAPTNEKSANIQSDIDEIRQEQAASEGNKTGAYTQMENNINNNNPMQLEIKTIQAGTGDRTVKTGDTIAVYYTGKLTNGKIFDSNAGSGRPFEFKVGAGMVIQGWEQGFIGAKIGEKRTLTIPSDLGYGPNGMGPIPSNSTLIFDVELVSIK